MVEKFNGLKFKLDKFTLRKKAVICNSKDIKQLGKA